MKIIRKAKDDVSNLFPNHFNQSNTSDVTISRYTHFEQISEDKIVLFSFISDAIVLLNKDESTIIKRGKFNNNLELFEQLQKNGFFINKCEDEASLMMNHRLSFDEVDTNTLKITILPTTNCNARCAYCCGYMNPIDDMTIETAKKTVEFIVGIAKNYKRLHIGWYGGEPLLKNDLITFICNEIRAKLPLVDFSSYIISNTSLINETIVDDMVNSWKVERIGITFDGIESEHNCRKNYIDNSINGYEQTLKYIQPLLDAGIFVQCRFNVDKNNLVQLEKLLEILKPYLNHKLFYFYVAFIKGNDADELIFDKNEYNDVIYEISKIYKKFNLSRSLNGILKSVYTKWCQGKNRNSVCIGPNGNIYKCNLADLEESNSIGTIFSGIEENENYKELVNRDIEETCLKCKFFPICQGGCPYDEKRKSKSTSRCTEFRYCIRGVAKALVDYYD